VFRKKDSGERGGKGGVGRGEERRCTEQGKMPAKGVRKVNLADQKKTKRENLGGGKNSLPGQTEGKKYRGHVNVNKQRGC